MLNRLRRLLFALPLLLAAGLVFLASDRAQAYPEPNPASTAWQLDFEFNTPQQIAVRDGNGARQLYWYMTYTVTNRTGRQLSFTPEFTVVTDTGDIVTAGRRVPATVFPQIAREVNNDLLVSPAAAIGPLIEGVDYARDSVVIWPAFGHDIDQMTIFVEGLSGELQTIEHPVTGEPVLMRRSRMLTFATPGSPRDPLDEQATLVGQRDVMR